MTRRKIAHEIVIDHQKGELRIDGIAFPYHVLPDTEVLSVGDEVLGAVQIGVVANNISIIGSDGAFKPVVVGSHKADMEWAAARARELVRDDLAHIIQQLPIAEREREWRAGAVAEMERAQDSESRAVRESFKLKAEVLRLRRQND